MTPEFVAARLVARTHQGSRRLGLSCLVLVLGGCAKVTDFYARPGTICSGDAVEVSWKARGSVRLFQIPLNRASTDQCSDALIAGLAGVPVSSVGKIEQPMFQNTLFYLEARGVLGRAAFQCTRIFVDTALPLSAIPECAGPRTVRGAASRPLGARWSTSTKVGVVVSLNDVPVLVRHDGREVAIAPRASSDGFMGAESDGAWSFEFSIPDGPDCGREGVVVPPSLSLRVLPQCQK